MPARQYLQEALGVPTQEAKPWARADELPYFLRDAFRFSELALLGQSIVLAVPRSGQRHSLSEVRRWLDKVRAVSGQPVLYGTDTLASYERKRLIEQKVPFIVPGNQLYLPDLGLDLREYFRRPAPAPEGSLSPAAQALLITALLRQPWQAEWQPSAMGCALGYSAMTLSRVIQELAGARLATPYTVGRSRWLRMESAPRQIWDQAKPMLRTPVKRTVWVPREAAVCARPRLAGSSALARYSMLAESASPVYAVGPITWKAMIDSGVRELPGPIASADEWQLWRYNPALVPDQATVDPLSLILSMENDADDRVQIALDALKEQLPW